MLNGISIYVTDVVWKKILGDFGANIIANKNIADVDFDSLDIQPGINSLELKSAVLNAANSIQKNIMLRVFGRMVKLPEMQMRIVTLLSRREMSSGELRIALGFSSDSATHAVDTAISQLRKKFGREFIQNKNGRYIIGI